MNKRPLYLHEEVLLLALDDEKGTFEPGAWSQPALAGAIIGELLDGGRLTTLKDGKREVVKVIKSEPFGEALLDDYLALIKDSKKSYPAKHWAGVFSVRGDLIPRTAESLCALGVLRTDERKVLLFFTRKSYPEVDATYEDDLVERLRVTIFEDDDAIDSRTQMLVAIANQTRLLQVHFDKKDLAVREGRIKAIVNGDLAGAATKGAIELANTAFFMTSVSAMVPIMVMGSR